MTLPEVLDRLLAMPPLLAQAAAALVPETRRVRAPGGGFSLVEHAWHLADLEREGYGARITRLLSEPEPRLPDFDGDRIARERSYQAADPDLGIKVFADARAFNAGRLRALAAPALLRRGFQDEVGAIALGQVPLMMARHDQGHAAELAALLTHLGAPPAVVATLHLHASAALPASPDSPSSHPAAA